MPGGYAYASGNRIIYGTRAYPPPSRNCHFPVGQRGIARPRGSTRGRARSPPDPSRRPARDARALDARRFPERARSRLALALTLSPTSPRSARDSIRSLPPSTPFPRASRRNARSLLHRGFVLRPPRRRRPLLLPHLRPVLRRAPADDAQGEARHHREGHVRRLHVHLHLHHVRAVPHRARAQGARHLHARADERPAPLHPRALEHDLRQGPLMKRARRRRRRSAGSRGGADPRAPEPPLVRRATLRETRESNLALAAFASEQRDQEEEKESSHE